MASDWFPPFPMPEYTSWEIGLDSVRVVQDARWIRKPGFWVFTSFNRPHPSEPTREGEIG